AKRLGLSYTFVRSLEEGLRRPSDEVLIEIASKLELDADLLLLAAYCDRSKHLEGALRRIGLEFLKEEPESPPEPPAPDAPLPDLTAEGFVATDNLEPPPALPPGIALEEPHDELLKGPIEDKLGRAADPFAGSSPASGPPGGEPGRTLPASPDLPPGRIDFS
ncbi:MAG: helix-turn-helix transcriptional regulator, partial [Planctomycetota bacterium]